MDADEFLEHNGVLGMHWGHHKGGTPTGASGRTDREAHKDANEFAKAKLFYGQGAGTRRKLIKATVEAKMGKDPEYKKAFEHHLSNQDLGKRASQARSQRKRIDTRQSAGKTARGVHRLATGGFGNTTLAAAVVFGGAGIAHKTGADRVVFNAGKSAVKTALKSPLVATIRAALAAKGL